MTKKILSLVLALSLIFVFAIFASALSDENFATIDSLIDKENYGNSTDYVYDIGNSVLRYYNHSTELTEISNSYYDSLGIRFYFVGTGDAYGETTEQFFEDFVNHYIGVTEKAVIFGVDLDNCQVYIDATPDLLDAFTFKEMQLVYGEALEESLYGSAYDWPVYFEIAAKKAVIALNGDYETLTDTYTAENGYDYSYFAPYYDSLMESAHTYDNVWDFANLLNDHEEAELQELAEKRLSERGVNVYFLTYDDACGVDERTFTDDFYDFYITKLDFDNEVDGVLYAVDMDNRQVYINTSGSYKSMLTSSKAYSLLDDTYSYASDEEYYSFFVKTDKATMKYLFPSTIEKVLPSTTSLVISLIVAIVIVLIVFAIQRKSNKKPVADVYQQNFQVLSRNSHFMGHREEVIHDFYKPSESSGGGGGGHSSGGGGSHGGGGHGF